MRYFLLMFSLFSFSANCMETKREEEPFFLYKMKILEYSIGQLREMIYTIEIANTPENEKLLEYMKCEIDKCFHLLAIRDVYDID